MKDLLGFRLYSRAARLGSISAAAKECGLSQSQASRIISELEASLGVRLLSRTTRAVVPTDAGGEFLVRVEGLCQLKCTAAALGHARGAKWPENPSRPTLFAGSIPLRR